VCERVLIVHVVVVVVVVFLFLVQICWSYLKLTEMGVYWLTMYSFCDYLIINNKNSKHIIAK